MVAQVLVESEKVVPGSPRKTEYGAERALRFGRSALPSEKDGFSRSGLTRRFERPSSWSGSCVRTSTSPVRDALLDACCVSVTEWMMRSDERTPAKESAARPPCAA